LAPNAAVADVTEIKADPQKSFKHRPSGIVLSALAAGIPRSVVEQFDDKQLDFAAEFRTADDKEITTVYIFRNVTGDVPLWFDRIQRTIEARDVLANPTVAVPAASFTPAGQPNARALRVVYVPGASPWTSTAAALTSIGDWYVAIRASSQTLSPEQMLVRLEESFAAIKWPKEKVAAPNAYLIADCPNTLVQNADAEPVKDDGSVILMSALAGNVGEALKAAGEVKPARWCRDAYTTAGAGLYRPDGANDRYFIAFQDAGRGIMVQPNGLAGILAGAKNYAPAPLTYMVELIEIDRRIGFGSFATLPNVAQTLKLPETGTRKYSASTWGKGSNIEINADAMK
jgi:hypothetical protein